MRKGVKRGDGYTPADFAGLSADERDRARAMMLARALDGDDIDLGGLRYVGDAATVAALNAAKDSGPARRWDYDITRLDVLFTLTGDAETYLAAFSRHLDGRDKEAQVRASGALSWHVLPIAAESFLVDRISDGRHEAALLGLLQAWIGIHERVVCDAMCFQRHLGLIREVSAAGVRKRRALLAEAGPRLMASAP